jgi:probable blue pigment (indigoidine) exporter
VRLRQRRLLLTASSRRHALELILAAACWGVGTAVSKRAVTEFPPQTLLAIQLALSVAFLGLVAVRQPAGARWAPGRLGRLGLLNPGLAYALSLIGLTQITASLSVLVWAIEPIAILALAALVLRERVDTAFVALSAAAIAGLLIVLYDPAASGAVVGVALTLAGVGCCAVYTVASRRWLPDSESTRGVILAQQVHAFAFALVLVAAFAVAGSSPWAGNPTAGGVVSALVSGIVYYGLAYWLYLSALRHLPASIASASFYLIPVFGLIGGAAFGERLAMLQWVGAAVVIGAVAGIAAVSSRSAPAVRRTAA